MNRQQPDTVVPWYQVKMVWLVLAIPTATVVGCMFTIFLAITNPDTVYKRAEPGQQTVESRAQ
ncbi:MAG: hypothetical protein AAF270_07620 [Pseudomonadota bacterium]